jgi:hypothetical protein
MSKLVIELNLDGKDAPFQSASWRLNQISKRLYSISGSPMPGEEINCSGIDGTVHVTE